jgi:hypothetical protein
MQDARLLNVDCFSCNRSSCPRGCPQLELPSNASPYLVAPPGRAAVSGQINCEAIFMTVRNEGRQAELKLGPS